MRTTASPSPIEPRMMRTTCVNDPTWMFKTFSENCLQYTENELQEKFQGMEQGSTDVLTAPSCAVEEQNFEKTQKPASEEQDLQEGSVQLSTVTISRVPPEEWNLNNYVCDVVDKKELTPNQIIELQTSPKADANLESGHAMNQVEKEKEEETVHVHEDALSPLSEDQITFEALKTNKVESGNAMNQVEKEKKVESVHVCEDALSPLSEDQITFEALKTNKVESGHAMNQVEKEKEEESVHVHEDALSPLSEDQITFEALKTNKVESGHAMNQVEKEKEEESVHVHEDALSPLSEDQITFEALKTNKVEQLTGYAVKLSCGSMTAAHHFTTLLMNVISLLFLSMMSKRHTWSTLPLYFVVLLSAVMCCGHAAIITPPQCDSSMCNITCWGYGGGIAWTVNGSQVPYKGMKVVGIGFNFSTLGIPDPAMNNNSIITCGEIDPADLLVSTSSILFIFEAQLPSSANVLPSSVHVAPSVVPYLVPSTPYVGATPTLTPTPTGILVSGASTCGGNFLCLTIWILLLLSLNIH